MAHPASLSLSQLCELAEKQLHLSIHSAVQHIQSLQQTAAINNTANTVTSTQQSYQQSQNSLQALLLEIQDRSANTGTNHGLASLQERKTQLLSQAAQGNTELKQLLQDLKGLHNEMALLSLGNTTDQPASVSNSSSIDPTARITMRVKSEV
jgi:hypothetical protein